MIELRDKDKNRVAGLVDYENLCIESILESGDKTLSFYYPKKGKYYDEIVEEAYIKTKKDEFVVKARELDEDYTKFECSLNLEELEGNIFDRFESVEQTITSALNLAVVGTGWTVKDNTLKKRRTVRCTNKRSLEIVREIKKVYRVDIVFNTLGKQIEVYEHLGEDKGTYFIDSLNLIALQVQSDSRQYATRIIAEGKDGLSFSDINNGKNYVENYQYSNKVKTIYWKDERYSVKENLLEDARAKLEELSKPFRSYSASILNLAELNPRYSSILDFKLGDAINLISKKNKIKDKQRIVKTIEWPQDHTKDSVELANATLKFEDIQQENQETTDTVNNITTDNGTVDGSTIDSITTKQIEDFEANVIKVAKLKAILAEIENLHVNKADIQNLNAVIARIGTLEATKASITELNAIHAIIQQIKAGKADIADLNAAVAKVGILENKTAVLENALAGNLTADNFKTNAITAGSAVIAEGAIGSSQISSLSVNKLEAGDITTSKHRIVSADGTIEIVGNQILINRNNVNRVILGEYRKSDGTTEYGLLVRAKDGQTIMLDGNGVHNAGITDGAIDNNKVADNANISGNKLDINSVIREVNTHGTETIKGTKVQIGDRTLDVELSTQKNAITEHSKELSSQKASLTALDNALKFKVDSQTFTQSTETINSNINRAKEEAIIKARSIPDTRNYNQPPSWYMEKYPNQTITEFKFSDIVQISGPKVYGTLETTTPWWNASGGYPTQIFRSSSTATFQRHGINEDNWSEWEQIENTQGALSKANEALNNAKAFVNAEITTVNSHLNKATAEINVLKEKIESKVSQVDIDKSIENVKFGDRNLFPESYLGSHGCAMGKWNNPYMNIPTYNIVVNRPNQGNNFGFNIKKPIKINGGKGVTFTFLFNYIINKYINNHSSNMHGYTRVYYKDGSKQDFDFNSKIVNCNDKSNWGKWISLKFYFTTDINKEIDNIGLFYFYTDGASEGTNFDFTIPKLVIGNKIGDWTPAPEDTDQLIVDNIKTVTDKISTVESKFTQENNSIKASVQDLNSTTQNITTNVSNINRDLTSKINSNLNAAKSFATDIATNKANTAKQEAISSANNIASSKAAEALNNAKAYTKAEITTINSKVHNVESNLNILSDKINTKVSQSDVDKSISEMKFNDINMILNSSKFIDTEHWSCTNGTDNLIVENNILKFKFKNYAPWGCYISNDSLLNKPLDVSKEYTVVCKLKASRNQNVGFNICDGNSYNYLYGRDLSITTEWQIFKFTFKPTQVGNERQFRFITSNLGYEFDLYIEFVKMVEGKITSDSWTISPEDVIDNIKITDSKISDVSSSVTQLRDSVTTQINAINSKTHSIETNLGGKASKQEVTEVNNRVTTIKASLDGITQRVSATESKTQTLESNLNGKASKQEVNNVSSKVVSLETNLNGITNRVSNTESRINTLDGKVASAVTNQQFTEFKQSNDKFKFTVEQRSSVSNILPNSSFHGGDRGWLHGGVEFWAGAYSGYGFKGRITGAIKNRAAYNNPERYLQTHKAYKVKKNTTYTITFHYICEKNVQSMDAFVVLSDTEHGDYAQPICVLTAQGGSQSNAAEEKPFTYKFNTGNHEWVWLRFDHNGMKSGVNWDEFCWIYVSEVGIYEGDVGAVKWIPKGGEVYSANYQMDGLGFKGTFEDGTYASLGKDGLEWYNAGTGHAYHALTYVTSFDVPIGNPGKAYIKLPAEFTKRRSSLKWTVALRGYYYSTDGDFFPFHIHCTGGRDYIENGLVVCEVQGYCKIQNAQNAGDVQFRPLTAMLIAIA
ncbi:phage tail protein [Clostridium perfringens]|uniref:phage tail protein n=1 Tax=Clostridium perfringens TaxID=1502 RepID=UPI0023F97AFE|nr:phage tail protein [Clostridium perfringens]WEV23444.1 phage tail protein [Clostridium perfringens D]